MSLYIYIHAPILFKKQAVYLLTKIQLFRL